MKSKVRERGLFEILLISIVLFIGVFHVMTIRVGHDWGGDFSMYIHHAKNITTGHDYSDTGYIYNPYRPSLGPKTYPPVFPIVLSPVYKWFGLDLKAMKYEVALFFVLSLFAIYLVFSKELSQFGIIAIIIILGLNPFFWRFKDSIRPDLLFLLLNYLVFALVNSLYDKNSSKPLKSNSSTILCSLLLGFLIYLTYGTRSIGLILVPSIIIYDVIRFKKLSLITVISISIFFMFAVLQNVFLHSESSYFDQIITNPKIIYSNISSNVFAYGKSLRLILNSGFGFYANRVLFGAFFMLALCGFLKRVIKDPAIYEVFLLLYTAAILIWPSSQGIRFLIPLIPLYVFYIFTCVEKLTISEIDRSLNVRNVSIIVLFLLICTSYMIRYMKYDYGPIDEGIMKSETIQLFNYIEHNTNKNDIFVFRKPRVLSLCTGRPASVYHEIHGDENLFKYFRSINAKYLIESDYLDNAFLKNFVQRNRSKWDLVYSNPDFQVFRIQ